MIIQLYPIRSDAALTLIRQGDRLILNGQVADFSDLAEGESRPCEAIGCDWIVTGVTRRDGRLHLGLLLPHGPLPFPPPEAAWAVTHPAPLEILGDGPVALPAYAWDAPGSASA